MDSSNRSNGWWTSSEILTFIFDTSRELPKEKADFANIECLIMCTNKDFVSTLIFEYNTHWKALESLKICEQTFVCFQSLFLRPQLHNSSASQAELVTDCWDERTVSWTLARWTLACHFAQLKNVCCLTHRHVISPSMELDTLHCLMRHATFVFTCNDNKGKILMMLAFWHTAQKTVCYLTHWLLFSVLF